MRAPFLALLLTLVVVSNPACRVGSGQFQVSCEQTERLMDPGILAAPMGVNSTALGSKEIAQTFTASADFSVQAITLNLVAPPSGLPPLQGALVLTLETDFEEEPTGNALGMSSIPVGSVKANGLYEFKFASSMKLSAGFIYWLRLRAEYAPDSQNVVSWQGSAGNPYADGQAFFRQNSSWVTTNIGSSRDLLFQLRCVL